MNRFTLSDEMESCIRECYDCADVCTRMAVHGLTLGGQHAAPHHQGLLHDCADICIAAARFLGRASSEHPRVCRLCATVCRACMAECRAIANPDARVRRCIEACEKCAACCEHAAAVAT